MRSEQLGASTSAAEVTNVSPHGFWLLLDGEERFLPFGRFPWFADASIAQLARVERPFPHHLYWPELDIDLHVDSIDEPDSYPLVSGARPDNPPRRTPPSRSRSRRR
jgi:hypothetical protein